MSPVTQWLRLCQCRPDSGDQRGLRHAQEASTHTHTRVMPLDKGPCQINPNLPPPSHAEDSPPPLLNRPPRTTTPTAQHSTRTRTATSMLLMYMLFAPRPQSRTNSHCHAGPLHAAAAHHHIWQQQATLGGMPSTASASLGGTAHACGAASCSHLSISTPQTAPHCTESLTERYRGRCEHECPPMSGQASPLELPAAAMAPTPKHMMIMRRKATSYQLAPLQHGMHEAPRLSSAHSHATWRRADDRARSVRRRPCHYTCGSLRLCWRHSSTLCGRPTAQQRCTSQQPPH